MRESRRQGAGRRAWALGGASGDTAQACPRMSQCITPLGSPWPSLKCVSVLSGTPVRWSRGGCGGVGTRGGVLPGGYHGRGTTRYTTLPVLHWYCQGPTLAWPSVTASLQALRALPGPSAHLQLPHPRYPSQDQYRRDSRVYILKLVYNPECHWKSVMRPGILPVLKTGSETTTLNFQYFDIAQPSLTRNKWSRFAVQG